MIEFKNDSKLIFTDISSEEYREYHYTDGSVLRFDFPLQLNVSSNGHRIFLENGESFYVPKKATDEIAWKYIKWKAKEGAAHFVK